MVKTYTKAGFLMFIISFILNCPFKLKGPDDCKSILSIISGKIHTGIFSVRKTLVMKRYFHFLCLMLLRTSQVLSQKSKLLSSRHHSSFCKLLFATEGPSEHHSLAMKGHIIKKKSCESKKDGHVTFFIIIIIVITGVTITRLLPWASFIWAAFVQDFCTNIWQSSQCFPTQSW